MSATHIAPFLIAGCRQGQGASWPTCTGSSSAGSPAADGPTCSCGAEEQAAEEGQVRGLAVPFVAPMWPQGALSPGCHMLRPASTTPCRHNPLSDDCRCNTTANLLAAFP